MLQWPIPSFQNFSKVLCVYICTCVYMCTCVYVCIRVYSLHQSFFTVMDYYCYSYYIILCMYYMYMCVTQCKCQDKTGITYVLPLEYSWYHLYYKSMYYGVLVYQLHAAIIFMLIKRRIELYSVHVVYFLWD